jgi:organic radical activating enzyme
MKYLSIITNFEGDHIGVPATTISSLEKLKAAVKFEKAEAISVTGGDPLFEYDKHQKYFRRLLKACKEMDIPLELHTATIESEFPYGKCMRVVYHLRDFDQLGSIVRHGHEIVRVAFTVSKSWTLDLIDKIADFCAESDTIDELYFRRASDRGHCIARCCEEYLRAGDGSKWTYVERFKANPPYFINGIIHYEFSDILCKEVNA